MKIQYLGTAAAEATPALFCDCDICRRAAERGGRNVRSRSQAVIDDRLLIDFPADTFDHCVRFGLDLRKIRHCLITHTHGDHFYPGDLAFFDAPFSHPAPGFTLTVYGSEDVASPLQHNVEHSGGQLQFCEVRPFEPFDAGGYRVTALKALHGTPHPYIYMISDGEKTLLYGNDSDIFPEETWEYLARVKPHFDLVSLDCTEGAKTELPWRGHMCLGYNLRCREMLREYGLIDDTSKVVLNHFSHNGQSALYDDFVGIAAQYGFEITYDGMTVNI